MGDLETKSLICSKSDNVTSTIFTPAQISALHSPVLGTQLEFSQLTTQDLVLPRQSRLSKNPYPDMTQNSEPIKPEVLAKDWEEFQNAVENNNLKSLFKFIENRKMSKANLVSRWQLVFDVLLILRRYYPKCEVYPFGSLITGLGDSSSDIDIWVDINGDRGQLIQENSLGKKFVLSILENVKEIIQQSQCPHNEKIPFTQNAKSLGTPVPYLKFIHNPSQIECDFTFGNRLTLQNSRLTQLYMKLDHRLESLLAVLFYWKNYGPAKDLKVRKYPLILLTIQFFIQKGILPTVNYLQALAAEHRATEKNPDEILGWDSSFCEDIRLIKTSFTTIKETLQQTVPELFKEFMQFLATTDFTRVVVCPLLGEMIPKQLIADENLDKLKVSSFDMEIPILWTNWAAKQRKLKTKLEIDVPLCVQDPFVLNDNVSVLTDLATLNDFQKCCRDWPKYKN